MANKENFYKTEHEKLLKKVIDSLYNDYIGGDENAYLDGDDYCAWTEASLILQIENDILTEENYLSIENSWETLEAKHIRFMGKDRVHEIVEHRIQFRHNKEGKWMWEI